MVKSNTAVRHTGESTKYYRAEYQTPRGPAYDIFIGTSMEDAREEALRKVGQDVQLLDVLEYTNETDAMII